MAEIVGCMAMSHGPQLLTPPDKWSELPARIKGPFNRYGPYTRRCIV